MRMEFILQSERNVDYLDNSAIVNYNDQNIRELLQVLFQEGQSDIEKIQIAFQYVRDEIAHSMDIQGERVTYIASEVLKYKQGICYAKANLLAALLRSQGIPTGFCYQRLMRGSSNEDDYVVHALNAVYLKAFDKWVRIDARGNKNGVDAQFLISEEKVAYDVNETLGEVDYPMIYVAPVNSTISILKEFTNAMEMIPYLPKEI